MTLKLHYYHSDKEYTDISQIVAQVQWTGEVATIHRKIQVTLQNSKDMKNAHTGISAGKWVIMYWKNVEIFRGIITSFGKPSSGQTTFTVMDNAWYLTKNSDIRVFKKLRADQIVRQLCTTFGIVVGSLANTGYVLQKLAYPDGETLRNIMVQAVTETTKRNKRRFAFKSEKGKLILYERKSQVTRWNIEDGITLTEANVEQSIEDTYNSVKLIGDDKDGKRLTATSRNQSSVNTYGIMQAVETFDGENPTQSALNAQAKTLVGLKSGVVHRYSVGSVTGQTSAISGSSIYCYNKLTGLIGGYYIINDTHTFDSSGYTMSLTLNTTDDLPKMDYTPPSENTTKV